MAKRKRYPQLWEETRRVRAMKLLRHGWTQAQIAEVFGVTRAAVCQWKKLADEGGKKALRSRPRSGAPCRLVAEKLEKIPELLWHGAEAYGFLGDVWTCRRISKVIEREFGVRYHRAHVSRILKSLDWTPQRPIVRATQRDENAIENWRKEGWPDIKKEVARKAER